MAWLKGPDRFWAKVEVGEPDECWPWTGAKRGGYGRFWSPEEQRPVQATYFLVKYLRGMEPGEVQMHTCDNPSCCNPAHVVPGTTADNILDKCQKGRHHNQREVCKRGHSRWGVHQRRDGSTRRQCLDCKSLAYHEAKSRG